MTMRTVTENGKVYQIDDNGMVVKANAVDATEAPAVLEFEEEALRIGERVEVDGRLGKIMSRIASVYGDSIGVKFDDGSFDEYLASDLERTAEESIHYDQPIDEVKADWTTYQDMAENTLDEVDQKAAVARRLNVTAKALVTDSRTPLSERVELDHIIISTGTDLYDLRDKAERLDVLANQSYLDRLPQYSIGEQFTTEPSFAKEDVSWVIAAADTATEELAQLDWERHLTAEALQATARLNSEQLANEEFMKRVASYREDTMPRGFDAEKKAKFHSLLETARQNALAEREVKRVAKTAKVEEELDDFDTAALYL